MIFRLPACIYPVKARAGFDIEHDPELAPELPCILDPLGSSTDPELHRWCFERKHLRPVGANAKA